MTGVQTCALPIFIESIIINIFNVNSREFWGALLGVRDSQVMWIMNRYGINLSFATLSEPGYVAIILLIYYNLYYLGVNSRKKNLFYALSILTGILSGSTMAIAIIVAQFIYVYIRSIFQNNIKVMKAIKSNFILFAGIFLIGLLFYRISTVNENIVWILSKISGFLTGEGGRSEVARYNSLKYAMSSFFSSPFLGVGYGSTSAPGLLPTMLASLGIIGTYLYLSIIVTSVKKVFYREKDFLKSIMNIILWCFIGQFSLTYSPIIIIIIGSIISSGQTKKLDRKQYN